MRFVVFCQQVRPTLHVDALGADLEMDACAVDSAAPLPAATVRLRRPSDGLCGTFRLLARPIRADDVAAARRAAARGGAAGMDALAARCASVVEVEPDGAPLPLSHALCAALAARGLGPILPPDETTLLGVRSAARLAETQPCSTLATRRLS